MLKPFQHPEATKTGRYFQGYNAHEIKHLEIEHPDKLLHYLTNLPHLTSASINFSKSAFKSLRINHLDFIKQVLENSKLTRLQISGSNRLTELPAIIKSHPLISLKVRSCPNLIDLSAVLSDLPKLMELDLFGHQFIVGNNFPTLPDLRFLSVFAEKINTLQNLSTCTKIEEVSIGNLEIEKFPSSILEFPELRFLRLTNLKNLFELPSLSVAKKLEALFLKKIPLVKELGINFSALKKLNHLEISVVGNAHEEINFPTQLTECNELRNLKIYHSPISELPKEFENFTKLESIEFHDVPLKSIPNTFQKLNNLGSLRIHGAKIKSLEPLSHLKNVHSLIFDRLHEIENIDIDFSNWKKLSRLSISNILTLKNIDSSLAKVESLTSVHLSNLPQLESLPLFSKNNNLLNSISIEMVKKISTIPESYFELTTLEKLNLKSENFESFPDHFDQLQNLKTFNFIGNKSSYLPLSIALLSNLTSISFYKNPPAEKQVITIRELYPLLKEIDDDEIKKAIVFWIGDGYQVLPMTESIKIKTFEILNLSLKNFPLFLFPKLYYLNPKQLPIQTSDFQEGDKVWINGKIQGTKTALKNKLTKFGLTIVNKFSEDIRLVVVGQKPEIPDGLFNKKFLFTSQLGLENLSKEEHPGMLQKEDVPENFIRNLQELIWSADPQNEAIALELVKSHGLPESMEEDFLLAAKTCTDKNLKTRIRNFIKSKISPIKQKALSKGGAYFKVRDLMYILPVDSFIKINFAQFKRTGLCVEEFLRLDNGEHFGRAEVFEKVLPKFLVKSNLITHHLKLLPNEWNLIFSNSIFKGNLNRVVVNLNNCDAIPKQLNEHVDTLKTMEINCSKGFDFASIFPFFKLTKLQIVCHDELIIPEGIGNLKNLRQLEINSPHPITMPTDFAQLKKLKTIYIGNFKNKENFREYFSHLCLFQ